MGGAAAGDEADEAGDGADGEGFVRGWARTRPPANALEEGEEGEAAGAPEASA